MKRAIVAVAALFMVAGAAPPPDYLIALKVTDPRAGAGPAAFPRMTVTAGTWGRVMAGKPAFAYDISVMPRPDSDRPGSILLRWQIVVADGPHPQVLTPVMSVEDGRVAALEVPANTGSAKPGSKIRIEVNARRVH